MGDFEEGDTVKLKSGGPTMTVEGESQFGGIVCTWFDGNEVKSRSFMPKSLKLVEEDE